MFKEPETNEMKHWASVKACQVILNHLKKDGEIHDYILVRDNSPLDLLGVDLRILMKRENNSIYEIPIQVKSSAIGVQEHYRRPNQHIDAVHNGEGSDLIEQFLDILDKHAESPPVPSVFIDKKDLAHNQDWENITKTILRLKKDRMRPRDIAIFLNSNGYLNKSGGKWYASTVGCYYSKVAKSLGRQQLSTWLASKTPNSPKWIEFKKEYPKRIWDKNMPIQALEIFHAVNAGYISPRTAADRLNSQEYTRVNGKPFTATQVSQYLTRKWMKELLNKRRDCLYPS